MNAATLVLLGLIVCLFGYDVATTSGSRRALWLQGLVFAAGGVLIVFPELSTRLAHLVGIGRGVDFVLYPTVLWLVRESLVARRHRREDQRKLEEAVRVLALRTAVDVHEPSPSSSRTE